MRNFIWFIFTLLALTVMSCQEDSESITQNPENSLTKTSALSSLIKRVSQYQTSTDNVIDNTSCFAIALPVKVSVDNQTIYVTNSAGYNQVQQIKDYDDDDSDIVTIVEWPITIIYPNFQHVVVSNQSQLNTILAQCGSDNGVQEIPCIDFNYPISINIYNTENQVGSTVAIQNDSQLYNFVQDMEDAEIVGIVYPITLTKSNGQQVVVNNNTQLEDAIDAVIGDCSSNSTTLVLSDVLTSGPWHVSYCYYTQDETANYNGYIFTFNSTNGNSGYSYAVKNSVTIDGDWDIHNEVSYQRLDLHFDGSTLYDLESNWKVQEYTANYIRLKHDNGGGSSYYLTLIKN